MGNVEASDREAPGERFREFLSSQAKRMPVTMRDEYAAWEEDAALKEEVPAPGETRQGFGS